MRVRVNARAFSAHVDGLDAAASAKVVVAAAEAVVVRVAVADVLRLLYVDLWRVVQFDMVARSVL